MRWDHISRGGKSVSSIFQLGLHFDLNYTVVQLCNWITHSCNAIAVIKSGSRHWTKYSKPPLWYVSPGPDFAIMTHTHTVENNISVTVAAGKNVGALYKWWKWVKKQYAGNILAHHNQKINYTKRGIFVTILPCDNVTALLEGASVLYIKYIQYKIYPHRNIYVCFSNILLFYAVTELPERYSFDFAITAGYSQATVS